MAKLKKDITPVVTITEEEYLQFVENTMIVEALKIAGIEKNPIWRAMERVLNDKHVEIHVEPLCRRYARK